MNYLDLSNSPRTCRRIVLKDHKTTSADNENSDDLQDLTAADKSVSLVYGRTSDASMVQFPPDTAGFLYYHAPPPGAPDIVGELRFRVTNNSDPSSFAQGHDLLFKGFNWSLPIMPAVRFMRVVRQLLLKDGLITEDVIARLKRLDAGQGRTIDTKSTVIYAHKQPFPLNLRPTSGGPRQSVLMHILRSTHSDAGWQDDIIPVKVAGQLWCFQNPANPSESHLLSSPGKCTLWNEPRYLSKC